MVLTQGQSVLVVALQVDQVEQPLAAIPDSRSTEHACPCVRSFRYVLVDCLASRVLTPRRLMHYTYVLCR